VFIVLRKETAFPLNIMFFSFLTLGNHDPEGGLKVRKIYKKLGMYYV